MSFIILSGGINFIADVDKWGRVADPNDKHLIGAIVGVALVLIGVFLYSSIKLIF